MKKRILSILLVVAMLAVMIPAFAVASSADAAAIDWVNDEVIVINTVDDFKAFHNAIFNKVSFAGRTVKLGADIDLAGVTGFQVLDNNRGGFNGTFDGQYHTISNFTYPGGTGYCGALFGSVGDGAGNGSEPVVIKNFALVNAKVSAGTRSSLLFSYVYDDISFENVYVNGTLTGKTNNRSGGFVGFVYTNKVNFKNCVFEGTITNPSGMGAFVGEIRNHATLKVELSFENCLNVSSHAFVGGYEVATNPKETTTNCYTYDAAQMGAGLTATAPAGFTALNAGYPVPATLLPFFAGKVNGTAAAEGVTTKYYGYQDNGSMTALRLIGLVNGEEANFTSVGFEITAVGPTGVTVSFVDDITSVYTSVETPNGAKTAEELGGKYIFVTEIGGIKPNAGVATFAVKTYSVDADGNKTYTDMVVVSLDTTVAN